MGTSVLIVDDDAAAAGALAMLLEAEGYQPSVANGARQARTYLGQRAFDYLMTDWRMPGEDGLTFLRSLVSEGRPVPPMILMSAFVTDKAVASAKRIGCSAVLPKPIEANQLFRALQEAKQRDPSPPEIDGDFDIDEMFEALNQSIPTQLLPVIDPLVDTEPSLRAITADERPKDQPSLAHKMSSVHGLSGRRSRRGSSCRRRRKAINLLGMFVIFYLLSFSGMMVMLVALPS